MTTNQEPTKLVKITLSAMTAVQYTEVMEVPANITKEELSDLVNDRYAAVSGDEFQPVDGSWERSDCGARDVTTSEPPTIKAIRVEGGLLPQEICEHGEDIPPRGLLGKVIAEEMDTDDGLFLSGKLEVPYRTGCESALPEKAVVEAACDAAVERLKASRTSSDVQVMRRDSVGRQGHCVILVVVPIYKFDTQDSAHERLALAFRGCLDIEQLFSLAA